MMDGCGGGMMLFGSLLLLALLGGVAWLIVTLVRRSSGGADAGPSGALGILEERYARGEIDAEEFDDRRRRLQR